MQLYETYAQQDNERLHDLLTPQTPGKEAEKNQELNRCTEVISMAKSLTKEQIQLKKMHRLQNKSLRQHLLYRFLNHYGYDKGEVTADAIVDDILWLIEDYFLVSSLDANLHYLHTGQLVWMAVPTNEYPGRGKTIAATRTMPVVLSFITDSDINHIAHGFDSTSLRKKRMERWVNEAFDQGGAPHSTRPSPPRSL